MTEKDYNFGAGDLSAKPPETPNGYTSAEYLALLHSNESLRLAHEVGNFVAKHQFPEAAGNYDSLHRQDMLGNYAFDGSEDMLRQLKPAELDPIPPIVPPSQVA